MTYLKEAMKHKYILILLVLNTFIIANDNIYISPQNELNAIPSIILSHIDNEEQLARDEKQSFSEGIPIRYAEMIKVNFNTSNSGEWLRYNENYDVWKLNIISYDAIGLKQYLYFQ